MKRFVMVMACALLFGAADAAWAKVAIVYEINGSAELIRNKESHRMTLGTVIKKGDRINVPAQSRIDLRLKDGSTLTVGANSTINIDAFTVEGPEKSSRSLFETTKGFFRYVSGVRRAKRDIKTPVGAIGIRGTDVFWEVKEEGGITVVGLVKCCVDVFSTAGTISLKKTNTFSKITEKGGMPSEPDPCKPQWLAKVKAALGASDPFFKDI